MKETITLLICVPETFCINAVDAVWVVTYTINSFFKEIYTELNFQNTTFFTLSFFISIARLSIAGQYAC